MGEFADGNYLITTGKHRGKKISGVQNLGDLMWYIDNMPTTTLGRMSRLELDRRMRNIFGEKTIINRPDPAGQSGCQAANQVIDVKNNLLTNYDDYD